MASIASSKGANPSAEPPGDGASEDTAGLSSLVYQSRSVEPLSDADLDQLVRSARSRNLREDVTGVMVYDRGRIMQWLEGPADSLRRVWQSIRHDRRHTGIAMLGQSIAAVRLFGTSAMALALRRENPAVDQLAAPGRQLPEALVEQLFERPQDAPAVLAAIAPRSALAGWHPAAPDAARVTDVRASLQLLVNSRIVPELLARHSGMRRPAALLPAAEQLAHLLMATEPGPALRLIERMRDDGRSITQLCASLFEPAARALGDLWQAENCSQLQVELGLANLQLALRQAGDEAAAAILPRLWHPHSVLVAPSPRESHLLGSAIASEIFGRAGWDVHSEFPDSDVALCRLVHDRWFDVLDLSLSAAFQRRERLPAMAASISAAHASSRNPGLIVMVNGRLFNEEPLAYADVGADVGSTSAQDLERSARSLVQRARHLSS